MSLRKTARFFALLVVVIGFVGTTSSSEDFAEEVAQASRGLKWYPFAYWRVGEFAGKSIRVDKDGLRATWNAKSLTGRTVRIFVFGSSTTWGMGARDEYTIPSALSRELHDQKLNVEVTNFGQPGYVNTQDLITLIRELQKGNIPDIAVFYDGVNEINTALQSNEAGNPQIGPLTLLFKKNMGWPTAKTAGSEQLWRSVVDVYRTNLEMIQTLAEHFHFRTAFFWQPAVYSKNQFVDPEEKIISSYDKPERAAFLQVNQLIKKSRKLHAMRAFHDISDVFVNRPERYFLDVYHLNEKGNEVIAKAMLPTLLRMIRASHP